MNFKEVFAQSVPICVSKHIPYRVSSIDEFKELVQTGKSKKIAARANVKISRGLLNGSPVSYAYSTEFTTLTFKGRIIIFEEAHRVIRPGKKRYMFNPVYFWAKGIRTANQRLHMLYEDLVDANLSDKIQVEGPLVSMDSHSREEYKRIISKYPELVNKPFPNRISNQIPVTTNRY